ncbi:MAG TPA: sigma-70 family RNA polymerase sigma factor [Balneolaceae bacterium]|nr:sigma-70 family RNA polymerase sigma factor [Balneolaceae bacterium]
MEITQLLNDVSSGDKEAYNKLYPLVYEKLKRIARHQLNNEYSSRTLSNTGLVHEAYEKLIDQDEVHYNGRTHFYAISARSMRQILVDYARKRTAQKRGGDNHKITLNEERLSLDDHAHTIIEINDLMVELKTFDERMYHIVELRFFGGLSIEDTAENLSISPSTVNREWIKARGWFYQKINKK